MHTFTRDQLRELARDVTALGGFIASTLILIFVFIINQPELFFQLLTGLIAIYVVSILIRHLHFKSRPRREVYTTWTEKMFAASFPSIHAARAWLFFIVLSAHLGEPLLIVLMASITMLICTSRIYLEKHDLKDVLGGSFFGILSGVLVMVLI